MVSSTLALLAFILAFTFNIAVNRFDDRRVAVLDEANAIGTTYLRAEFFEEPARERIKKLLREYVRVRVNGISDSDTSAQVVSQSESIQDKLWLEASVLARQHTNPICGLFISSLNEVIDLHAKRVTLSLHTRVPAPVWFTLLAVSGLAMVGLGYYCGLVGTRSWTEAGILIATFGVVMWLVADLDRPSAGLVRVDEQPMIELNKKLGPP
jgi:hypothetical protein